MRYDKFLLKYLVVANKTVQKFLGTEQKNMQKIFLGLHQINIILCNFLSQCSSLGSNPDMYKKSTSKRYGNGPTNTFCHPKEKL